MPDFTNIPNFQVRYKAPNTETLNGQLKNNLLEGMESIHAFNISGQQRLRVGGAWTYFIPMSAQVAALSSNIILSSKVTIPDGISIIKFNIFAAADSAVNYIRVYTSAAPGVFYDYIGLPVLGSIAWQGWQHIASSGPGQPVINFEAFNTLGGASNFYLRGALIMWKR